MTLGSHQRAIGRDQARFTPRWILGPLGPFAADACAGDPRPWDIAARNITAAENSLVLDWSHLGRIWCNPPFDTRVVGSFVRKMCLEGQGVLLLHARTDTQWFDPINDFATGVLKVSGRVVFLTADGSPCTIENPKAKHFGRVSNSGAPVVLVAFGYDDADLLASLATTPQWDERGHIIRPPGEIPGRFEPLRLHRMIAAMFVGTWRQAIEGIAPSGDFTVEEVYRVLAAHPKSACNDNVREKIRQTLNRGGFKRVARGTYRREVAA